MNFSDDLFLLMVNLSQLHNKEKIIEIFTDGLKDIFNNKTISFSIKKIDNNNLGYEILTRKSSFGYIYLKDDTNFDETKKILLSNACQMLALILENVDFNEKLKEEKNDLEKIAVNRLDDLQLKISELEKAKSDYHNLISVLEVEVDKKFHAEEEVKSVREQIINQYHILKNINDSSVTPIFSLDKNYCYTSFNTSHKNVMKHLYGTEIELGKNIFDCMTNEEDRIEAKKNIDETLTGKNVIKEAFSGDDLKSRNYFEVYHNPIYDNEKNIIGISVIARDLTERKKMEESLKESEEIFNRFMENSPIYVFFKDENIRATKLSKNYEQMLNRPLHEILGKNMDELFPSDFAKSMIEIDKKILNEGKLINIDEELDGRYYTTIKFPISINNIPKYLAGFTIDITDRKKIEIELNRLNERLEILISSLNQISIIHNTEQLRKLVISAARKLCSCDASAYVVKQNGFVYYSDEDSIEPLFKGNQYDIANCVSGWAILNKQPVVIHDIYNDPRVPIDLYRNTFIKSMFIVPINLHKPYGAIGCYWKDHYEASETDVKIIQTLADSTAKAIENITFYNELERRVEEKTKELNERVSELERFHDATINRELRMKELQDEIDRLKKSKLENQ